jgi:hypothetical protein
MEYWPRFGVQTEMTGGPVGGVASRMESGGPVAGGANAVLAIGSSIPFRRSVEEEGGMATWWAKWQIEQAKQSC